MEKNEWPDYLANSADQKNEGPEPEGQDSMFILTSTTTRFGCATTGYRPLLPVTNC